MRPPLPKTRLALAATAATTAAASPLPPPYYYHPVPECKSDRAEHSVPLELWNETAEEQLRHHRGFLIDRASLAGLSEQTRSSIMAYFDLAIDLVAKQPTSTDALELDRWQLVLGGPRVNRCSVQYPPRNIFPVNFDLRGADPSPIPVRILPALDLVRQQENADENRSIENLIAETERRGRTIHFDYHRIPQEFTGTKEYAEDLFRVLPQRVPAVGAMHTVAYQNYRPDISRFVMLNASYADEAVQRAFGKDLAHRAVHSEIVTAPLLGRVGSQIWWCQTTDHTASPATTTQTIVYPLWDALTGEHCDPQPKDSLLIPYSASHPGVARVPVPLVRILSTDPDRIRKQTAPNPEDDAVYQPQERIAISEAWAEFSPPVCLISKAPDWEPFSESLRFNHAAEDFANADDSLLAAAVFTSIQPEALVRLLSKLGGRDPEAILNDQEAMTRLQEAAEAIGG